MGSFIPRTDAHLYFGFRPGNGSPNWLYRGAMDEVALHDRALEPAEIEALFHADTAGRCPLPSSPVLATYVATEEFSLAENPNGLWSYGWSAGFNAPFQHFTTPSVEAQVDAWLRAAPLGTVYPALAAVRTNVDLLLFGYVRLSPDQLMLHPGPSGEYSVLRWTAPADGLYRARGSFETLATIGQPYPDVRILVNSTNQVFANAMSGGYQIRHFHLTQSLRLGDTIDFAVGYGPDQSYGVDNTGLRACVEALAFSGPNLPPFVSAGPDQNRAAPGIVTLNGFVSDDGWPADQRLITAWSQIEGPASVSFTNPGEPAITATFPQAGNYRLRLSAQDGTLEAWDEIDVTVHEAVAVNQPPQVDAG
ncbi:MAG TPA: hypothetical protein VLD18_08025, partial [Verrucomicrobiae bacterium]|nr:hypothetical protein [Verrucomicrobiae bacterium]